MATANRPAKELLAANEDLRLRLEEAEETLRAIGSGEVDAFVVSGPEGPQVFTLKGAEKPYRVLVETMNEGAATLAEDGTILFCNNRLAAMLQVPLESIIGTQLSSYVAPADLPLFVARLEKCAEECDKDEIIIITKTGTSVPVLISYCNADVSGNRCMSVVVTDITQQKRNEEVMLSERLARSIIEQAGEAIIVCDEKGRIIRASRLAHDLCGQNLLLKTFNELFKLRIPETGSQFSVFTPLEDVLFENVEVEFKRGDDQIYHLVLNAAPLKSVQNCINGCVVTLTDISKRKRAEEELRRSEERLRAANDQLQEINKTLQEQSGELQAANEELQTVNEELQFQSEQLQAQSEELQTQREELQAQNRELKRLWEESRRAEELLRASDREYAAMFESSIVGQAQADPMTGRFTRVNRTLTEMTGYSAEELCRMTFAEIIHPDDRQRDLQVFEPVRTGTADSWQIEKRYVRKDGSIIWVEVAGNVIRDADGRPTRTSAVIREITNRKRAEEALRQSEEKFAKAFAGNPAAITLTRLEDGLFLDVNDTWVELSGFSREEAIGHSASEMHIWPSTEAEARFVQALREKGSLSGWDEHFFKKSGDVYVAVLSAQVLTMRDEKVVLSALVDVTPRKQAEEALKKLNEELEKRVAERTAELRKKDQILLLQSRQAAMGEMIGNIAHQWRQPLNAVGLAIQQLVLFYDVGEFTREFLEKNVSQSMKLIKHMSKTIDDFRNYFRPDKEKAEFKVREAIANTVSLIGDSFKNQHINIEVIAKDDPSIFGYRNEFAQALLNILNNAKDALIEREIKDPSVTINICIEGDRAVVTIADNAGGIPEEIMRKIFDPYFTTKGPQDGTGIGLFMSKAIIEKNMGGRLAARNIADGVEFKIEV